MKRAALVALALAAAPDAAFSQVAREARDGPTLDTGAVFVEEARGPVRVTFSADRDEVPIVDRVKAVLAVEAPPWFLVSFPRVVGEIGSFRLLREEKAGPFTMPGGGERIIRNERRYYLDPTEAGETEIRALTLNVLDGRTVPSIACVYLNECRTAAPLPNRAAATDFVRIGPLPLEVTSVLPPDADFTDPKDILGPVPLPPPPPAPVPWRAILAAAAAAALLAAAGFGIWRLRRRGGAAAAVPMAAAHALALAALGGLDAGRLDTPEKVDLFYVRVSRVLRRYLDWRFGLRAAQRTTEEVLREASARETVAGYGGALGAFLASCDRVKFARHRPGEGEPSTALENAVGFVRDTADASIRVPAARAAEVA